MVVLSLLVAIVLHGFIVQANSVLPEAIEYAVASSFNKTTDLVHVVIETDNDENTIRFLDVVDNLLLDNNYWSFRFQIDVNNANGESLSDHNLWFIDSYEAFRRLLPWIGNYHRDSQLFHFIVLKSSNVKGNLLAIQKIFSDFLKLMVANVNLVIEASSGEASFYTFYPFQELACRSAKPSIIFQFNQNTVPNDKISFFPPKANNFYRCDLRIKTRNPIHLNLEVFRIENVIINELASRLNLTLDFVIVSNLEMLMLNKNSTGAHESLQSGETDMVVGMYAIDAKLNNFLSKSIAYLMTWTVIAIRYRPNVVHGWAWLFISFDSMTWMGVLLTLTVFSGCIFYVKKTKRFGSVVQCQHVGFLEVLAVFIGTSIERLPRKSCLRFLFVVLSLGALVLRTAYLGKLFDAYRGLRIAQPPHGFKELLAQNYTIYTYPYYASFINELLDVNNMRFEQFDPKHLRDLCDTSKKSAFFASFVFIYNFSTPQELGDSMIEPIYGEQIYMFFGPHSIVPPMVSGIIERLEEAGILHYFRRNYENINKVAFSSKKMEKEADDHDQRPLVFERLSFAFDLFVGLNVISCLIFAVEILWNRYTNI